MLIQLHTAAAENAQKPLGGSTQLIALPATTPVETVFLGYTASQTGRTEQERARGLRGSTDNFLTSVDPLATLLVVISTKLLSLDSRTASSERWTHC